jgi:hypothetical protein
MDTQCVEHGTHSHIPDILHTLIAVGIAVEGEDSLGHQLYGDWLLPLPFLSGPFFGCLLEVGNRIVMEMCELTKIADTLNAAVF